MKLGSGNSYWPTSKIIRNCKSQEVGRVSHIRPTTQKKQITTNQDFKLMQPLS